MHGQLSLGALAEQVQAQTIDTVVAAFPDMQGRLVGKRFHAGYFCESAHE
jgi:glutamine synthetase